MAIKKIKVDEVIKVVSAMDDAIDEKATGNDKIDKYIDTHNVKLLTFKKGIHPTYFHIRNILPDEQAEIQEEHYEVEMPDISKMKNPVDIKNAKPKIKQIRSQSMIVKYFKAGVTAYEEDGQVVDDFDHNIFPSGVVTELGSFILGRTQLGGDEKKS